MLQRWSGQQGAEPSVGRWGLCSAGSLQDWLPAEPQGATGTLALRVRGRGVWVRVRGGAAAEKQKVTRRKYLVLAA